MGAGITKSSPSVHIGVEGNEKADELARKGASTLPVRPEPICGLGDDFFKEKLKR